MKYIQNNGRYAIAFPIVKNGKEIKIELDRKRIFMDTGNIATSGITAVEDADLEELKKIKRFNNMLEAGELALTEKSAIETAETKVADLKKENAELREQLKSNPKAKELKEKDDEIKSLKAQIEDLTKDKVKLEEAPTEAPKDETEGF